MRRSKWEDVTKSLHLMNDSIGVGHVGLVCHLWTPRLPYDFINFLLDMAWRNSIPLVKDPQACPLSLYYLCVKGWVHGKKMTVTLAGVWVKYPR